MRIALTAGGTGGHIFPAFSVLDSLEAALGADLEVAFFGPENRGERAIVEARGLKFVNIPAAGVRGSGPAKLVKSGWRLSSGLAIALRHLRSFRPDAVFSTGGYASFPSSLAARILRKPLVVFLPDVSPGWAVRAEQRLATRMATTTEAALQFLPAAKTVVTGYPVRAAFGVSREEARAELGIPREAKVLLVAGASQGSSVINQAIFGALRSLVSEAWVLHVTGTNDVETANSHRSALEALLAERYVPVAFRQDLPVAMKAADLAIMRAGASVLGELPAARLPSILVPGTFAGGHQRDNAAWLESHGAARVVEEANLDRLAGEAKQLLLDGVELARMRVAAGQLDRPNAAKDIAELVMEVARK